MAILDSLKKKAENDEDKGLKADIEADIAADEAENAAEHDARRKMTVNKFEKGMSSTKLFWSNYKRQIIKTAALLVGVLILLGVANTFAYDKDNALFKAAYKEGIKEYNETVNNIEVLKQTHPYYTKVTEEVQQTVNWIGEKADSARIKADTDYFWDWISPVFSYKSADEFNRTVDDFVNKKGLDPNSLFVAGFLQKYDYRSDLRGDVNDDGKISEDEAKVLNEAFKCYTNEGMFKNSGGKYDYIGFNCMMPIGRKSTGDYHYVALVPMKSSASAETPWNMILFTFTAEHGTAADGSVTIRITDFNYWQQNKNDSITVH